MFALIASGPVFLTVTSGSESAGIHANGTAAKILPQVTFSPGEMGGRLLFGDSPLQSDSWEGNIFGLAV
jgi:hypothetical protein